MPGPVRGPLETVTPEVSECIRIPCRRRPVSRAATAWPPSWVIVTASRISGQVRPDTTSRVAARAVSTTTAVCGGG